MAVFSAPKGGKILTTAIEHPSVAVPVSKLEQQGFTVTRVRPEKDGRISAQALADAADEQTRLICLSAVNNETGAITPLAEAIPMLRRKAPRAHIHLDGVQGFLKLALPVHTLGADSMAVSGHKVHAPKGIGALYVRKGSGIKPRTFGGGQERDLRPGTESTPMIAAFAAAVETLAPEREPHLEAVRGLSERLRAGLTELGLPLNSPKDALPYLVNFSAEGIPSEVMLHFLGDRDICVSSGSACHRGRRSEALVAQGLPPKRIDSAIRVSFSFENTPAEVDRLLEVLADALKSIRRRR